MKKFLLILLAFLLTAAMVCTLAACDDDPAEHTHDYGTLIPETPADCGTNGTKAHYECDGCDKLFVDDNGEKKEVSASELVIPATGQHDYAGQPFVSGGASGHHQLCKVCGTPNADVAHDSFTYTHVSGQRQHTKKCGVCNYEVTENCTVEGNECTLCHADYTPVVGNDETITVHFHPTEWWNAAQLKLYAWYGDGQSTVYPLGAFPGGADFQADTENTGWYTYTFQVPEGHRGTDLYLIVNDKVSTGEDTYDGVQTGNINVTATELWIAGIVNTEQFYTSSQDATAAEANVPGKDAWIVVGSFTTPGWQNPTQSWDYVLKQADGYKLTLQFAAKDQFKITKNDGTWADAVTFGFDRMTYTADEKVTGDTSKLFTKGQTTNYNNIIVNYACKLEITFTPSTGAIAIKILEAPELPEIDDTNVTKYYLVGNLNGVEKWSDDTGIALNYDSASRTYKLEYSFKVGDQWKVKREKQTGDEGWDYGINAGDIDTKFTFNYGSITQPSKPLFEGSENIIVNHDCTVTIEYNAATDHTTITVSALTENTVEYTYTFYLYAPNWSNIKIHLWDNLSTGDWNNPTTMQSAGNGWWYYEVTSSAVKPGTKQNIILANKSLEGDDNRVTLQDSKAIILQEAPMYFKAKTNEMYSTWNQTGASVAPSIPASAAVAPVQVATVPQSISKSYLDYALAA